MRSHLEHIAVEQATLPPSDLQGRIRDACTRVRTVLLDIGERLQRVEALLDRDDPGDLSGSLNEIAACLESSVREVHAAVEVVRASSGREDARLDVLMHESAAGFVRASRDARQRLERLAGNEVGATEERYVFPCAECGATAVVFEVNRDRASGALSVRANGLTRSETLAFGDALLTSLRAREASAVHQLMPEGMDGYCPSCARVYCRSHYVARDEYDEGFYDCTRATCPRGHTRMIDD